MQENLTKLFSRQETEKDKKRVNKKERKRKKETYKEGYERRKAQKRKKYFTKYDQEKEKKNILLGRGDSQVVSVLAFYSDDPSLNPDDVRKQAGLSHLKSEKYF